MTEAFLILYTRSGCCLCESLESRLKRIGLKDFDPSLQLHVIDIDKGDLSEEEREKYDLEVPVMFIAKDISSRRMRLPRTSPRIDDKGFLKWLHNSLANIDKMLKSNL